MHDLLQDIWLLLSVRIFIPSSEHPKQAKIVLSARLFTTSIHVLTSVCFVVRGESPGCRLFGTASMLEWLRKVLPHHSQGSTAKRWSRNTSVLRPRFFWIMQWRRQRHLTWAATHDVENTHTFGACALSATTSFFKGWNSSQLMIPSL